MTHAELLAALADFLSAAKLDDPHYGKWETLNLICDAQDACSAGRYEDCAGLLDKLGCTQSQELRVAAMALAFDVAESAFDRKNEQDPTYAGRSGL